MSQIGMEKLTVRQREVLQLLAEGRGCFMCDELVLTCLREAKP